MKKNPQTGVAPLSTGNLPSTFFLLLYLLVDFIPSFEAFDIIGSQWLYTGLVNLLVLGYLMISKNQVHDKRVTNIMLQPSVISYFVYFVIAAFSILFAINAVEFLVCFSRLIITIIAFVNFIILIKDYHRNFIFLCQSVAIITLIKCLQSLNIFFHDVPELGLYQAILNMKVDAGNKNIFGSSIVVKMPFILYCIYAGSANQKLINLLVFIIVLYTLLLVNARASYVGAAALIVGYLLFSFVEYRDGKPIKYVLKHVLSIMVVVALAVSLAQVTIVSQRKLYGDGIASVYGTITERISSIGLTSNQTSGRSKIWKAAVSVIKDHPVTGVGFGNWKIASIPYEKGDYTDFSISLHAHNDLLETTGELGVFGGLAYLCIFAFAAFYSIKNLLSKKTASLKKPLLLISLIGLSGYFVDAMLNFPMERTVIQLYFALLLAINSFANFEISRKPGSNSKILSSYSIIAAFVLLPAVYVAYQTYESLVVQGYTYEDIGAETPVNSWSEVNDKFPAIPNITQTGLPIEGIKGRYLMLAGKYDEAGPYLKKAIAANPPIMYGQFLTGLNYYFKKQMDSAYIYAKDVFQNRPSSYAVFSLLTNVAIAKKDSLYLKKSFYEYNKTKPGPDGWNIYLYALTTFNYPVPYLKNIADSAFLLYPDDPKVIQNKKAVEAMGAGNNVQIIKNGVPVPAAAPGADPATEIVTANASMQKGLDLFSKKDYRAAIKSFQTATDLNPGFYPPVENIAMCYYLLNDFATALKYFTRVVRSKSSSDGKSEFFAGICLINTGKKAEGCKSFEAAAQKKYYDAQRLIDLNCK
jgi:O-antigen ligase